MKVAFNVKYGTNVIDIPIDENGKPKYNPYCDADRFDQKVTIYNDIPSDGVNPRKFMRYVIDKCFTYNQLSEGADGTIQKIINTQNVITKDVVHYKDPITYRNLPDDVKSEFFTAQIDDFVIIGEVDDVVTTSKEFQDLQKKYADIGFSVTSVSANLHGLSVDNIHIMHA